MLNLVAPLFAASLLIGLHDWLSGIEGIAKDFKEGVSWVFFCIALAALSWFAWRARKRALVDALEAENGRQMEALIDKAQNGELEDLAPNAAMEQLAAQIRLIDTRLASLHAATAPPVEQIAKLDQLREVVERRYIIADLHRRVDLTDIPVDEPGTEGFWPRIRLAAFSKGMQNLRKNVTPPLLRRQRRSPVSSSLV